MKIKGCIGCGEADSVSFGNSEAFVEIINGKSFKQEAYTILKCKNCGLYYKDNILTQELFNEYYNSFDFQVWTPDIEYVTEQVVEKYLLSKPRSKVLDYGCSSGRFISAFVQQHECYGYDIDVRALKEAAKKGIITITKDELVNYTRKLDVIILSDVFEHAAEPTKLISDLLKMLNKDGILVISTGYADAKACQYDLANFWYFRTIQHVCMMGADYINYLQARFKTRVLKKIVCSHYQASFKQKMFYGLRFNLYKFIDSNRSSVLVRAISRVPYISKITNWKQQPYYPYSKDHVVLFLQNEAS